MRTLLRDEYDLREVFRCLVVLLPLFLIALVSGDLRWQHALIPASAMLIGLAPLGVVGRAELSSWKKQLTTAYTAITAENQGRPCFFQITRRVSANKCRKLWLFAVCAVPQGYLRPRPRGLRGMFAVVELRFLGSCPSASLAGGVRFRAGAALGLRSFP